MADKAEDVGLQNLNQKKTVDLFLAMGSVFSLL